MTGRDMLCSFAGCMMDRVNNSRSPRYWPPSSHHSQLWERGLRRRKKHHVSGLLGRYSSFETLDSPHSSRILKLHEVGLLIEDETSMAHLSPESGPRQGGTTTVRHEAIASLTSRLTRTGQRPSAPRQVLFASPARCGVPTIHAEKCRLAFNSTSSRVLSWNWGLSH